MPFSTGLSVCHLLNDLLQSLLPAIYPMLKTDYGLDFWHIGMITFTNSVTASLLQPVVGLLHRSAAAAVFAGGRHERDAGGSRCCWRSRHGSDCCSSPPALVGVGSAIFHPESSRIARLASGGRHGFAQSLFQTGGNFGSSLGPLLAAFIVLPRGQQSVAWFSIVALVAIVILYQIGLWYRAAGRPPQRRAPAVRRRGRAAAPGRDVNARWRCSSLSSFRSTSI